MAEENKDVIDQLVTGQGVEAQSTTEQGVEGQVAAGDEKPAEQEQDEQQVPYSRFQEVNSQKKAAEDAQRIAEEQTQVARDQMALMQANQIQPQVEKSVSSYEQSLRDCGLVGEEYLSQEQLIQVNARKDQLDAVKMQQNQQVIANQQFAQSHPDFGKAVGQLNSVTSQFMASAELQKILMEKPHLRGSCYTAQGAYEIVMQERKLAELSQKAAAMQEKEIQEKVDANLSPMSPAAAGAGAVKRKKDLITESSDADDVRALEEKVKSGEFG